MLAFAASIAPEGAEDHASVSRRGGKPQSVSRRRGGQCVGGRMRSLRLSSIALQPRRTGHCQRSSAEQKGASVNHKRSRPAARHTSDSAAARDASGLKQHFDAL